MNRPEPAKASSPTGHEPGPVGDRDRRKYWIRAAVSSGILLVILSQLSGQELMTTLTTAAPGLVGLALMVGFLMRGAAALRLALCVSFTGSRVGFLDMLRINLAARFYTLVVPGGNLTAAVIRLTKIRRLKVSGTAAGAAVARDRVDATLGLLFVGALFLTLDQAVRQTVPTVALATVAALAVVGMAAIIESPVARGLDRIVDRIEFPFVDDEVRRFWGMLRETGRLPARAHLSAFGLSLVAHLLGTTAYYLLAGSLGLDLGFVRIGWVRAGVLVLTMVPVSLGGVGIREAAFILLLTPWQIPSEPAVALSILVFATTLLVPGVVGGIWEIVTWIRERAEQLP